MSASGSSTVTVPWPNDGDAHTLAVQGEGEVSGCNTIGLGDWGGMLTITYTPAPEACADLKLDASILRWETRRTRFDYTIRGIKRRCRPVSLWVADRVVQRLSADHATVSGQVSVPERFC